MGAVLRSTMPTVVNAAYPIAGVASSVDEDDLEVGALVHDAAGHERREGHRAIDQIAHGVRQVIALGPRAHQRFAALMEEDQRAELIGRLPERTELRLVEGPAVDVIVDLHALEADLRHAALELRDRGLHVLHREGPESRESFRPCPRRSE